MRSRSQTNRMPQAGSSLALSLALLVAGELPSPGEVTAWKAPVDGSWADGTNWTWGTPPVSGDTVYITNKGTFNVTMSAPVASFAHLYVGGGTGRQTLTWTGGAFGGPTTILTNGELVYACASLASYNGILTNYGVFRWPASSYGALAWEWATKVMLTGGTFHFQPGHLFNGPGTYGVVGNVVIDCPITEPNFLLSGGTLTMTNQITGTLVWQSGRLNGAPTTATNGVVRYAAGSAQTLSGVLTNHGLFLWPAGTYAAISFSNGRLENLPGALVDMRVDGGFYSDGSSAQVNNAGVIRKTVGTGTGAFNTGVGFQNTGLLDIQSGTMQLPGNSVLANGRLNCGLKSASDYGRIAFIGAAPLAGTLSASLIGGFSPAPGTQFQVLSSGGLSGGFTSFALPTHFYVTDNALSVFLTTSSGGPATLLRSTLAGSNFTFAFQSEAGLSYRVESSGDLAGTNWVFHTNFTGDGSLLQFATPVSNTTQRFFRLSKP